MSIIESCYQAAMDTHRKEDRSWKDCKYEWVKYASLTDKGKMGQSMIANAITQLITPAQVVNEGIGDYDIYLPEYNVSIEHKLATLDVSHNFQFNGISKTKDYDLVIGLGVAPDDLFFIIATRQWLCHTLTTNMSKDGGGFKWTARLQNCMKLTDENFQQNFSVVLNTFVTDKAAGKISTLNNQNLFD